MGTKPIAQGMAPDLRTRTHITLITYHTHYLLTSRELSPPIVTLLTLLILLDTVEDVQSSKGHNEDHYYPKEHCPVVDLVVVLKISTTTLRTLHTTLLLSFCLAHMNSPRKRAYPPLGQFSGNPYSHSMGQGMGYS